MQLPAGADRSQLGQDQPIPIDRAQRRTPCKFVQSAGQSAFFLDPCALALYGTAMTSPLQEKRP